MKSITLFLLLLSCFVCKAQNTKDKLTVESACLSYVEGFYEGDSDKLKSVLQPSLHKFGFWKNKETNSFGEPIYMTFDEAIAFADNIKANKNFAAEDAPKIVTLLDISEKIAVAKVTAWWGIDYIFLSKQIDEEWKIEQVIWEGPLKNQ